jgi:hypothetical protein
MFILECKLQRVYERLTYELRSWREYKLQSVWKQSAQENIWT